MNENDGLRTIKLTGGCDVQVKDGSLVVTPLNDGGFSVVVQNHIDLTLFIYHPLSGWYVQAGSGSIEGDSVSYDPGVQSPPV